MNHDPVDTLLARITAAIVEVVPGLAWTPLSPDDTITGSLGLDSLTVASFAVALNKTLDAPRAVETWIADHSGTGADSLRQLAAWLAVAGEGQP